MTFLVTILHLRYFSPSTLSSPYTCEITDPLPPCTLTSSPPVGDPPPPIALNVLSHLPSRSTATMSILKPSILSLSTPSLATNCLRFIFYALIVEGAEGCIYIGWSLYHILIGR